MATLGNGLVRGLPAGECLKDEADGDDRPAAGPGPAFAGSVPVRLTGWQPGQGSDHFLSSLCRRPAAARAPPLG